MVGVVTCSRCGKRVSNEVQEELIVRAWVECPECLEKAQNKNLQIADNMKDYWKHQADGADRHGAGEE